MAERGSLVLELEAVLRTEQLSDVRQMIEHRLSGLPEQVRWRVILAIDELVTNAVEHAGRCSGLRIYERPPVVRVEVDDPAVELAAPDPTRVGLGRSIVAGIARSWGEAELDSAVAPSEWEAPATGRTVWCELER